MKSQFRPRAAAAAILLASLGAAFVATPASAHNIGTAHSHEASHLMTRVEAYRHDGMYSAVAYRVFGVAGAEVFVDVPGRGRLPAQEIQPGVYEAAYVLRKDEVPVPYHTSTAILRAFGTEVIGRVGGTPTVVATPAPAPHVQPPRDVRPGRDNRDNRGPEIASVSPANGERVSERGRTRLTAQFSDDRSGVDVGSVRLRVDGRDVTRDSRVDGDSIQYRDNLAPGRHVAELTVRDRAGNTTRRSWTFDVVDTRPGYGWGDRNHEHDRRW